MSVASKIEFPTGTGNVAHDRRPQAVALIKLLTAGTATPPVLTNDRFAPKSDLEQKSNLRITGPH